MKKHFFLLTALLLIGGLYFLPHRVVAGGPSNYNIRLTPSASSAIADGGTTISVDVYAYEYHCSLTDGGINYYYTDPSLCAANGHGTATEVAAYPGSTANTGISVSGSGNKLSASSVSPDSSGHASFTLASSVAETKNISAAYAWDSATPISTIQVSFTAAQAPAPAQSTPSATTPKRSTTTSPTTTPTNTPAPTSAPAPAAPSLATVKVDGVDTSTASQPQVDSSKPLVLSGKTVPNGVLTLTIHSTPRTVTVTADKDGNWNYAITGLEPGSHYVEAAVTDPATKQTSAVAKVFAFTVTAPKVTATVQNYSKAAAKGSPLPYVIIGLVVLIALGAGGWYFWKKKHQRMSSVPPVQPPQA